MRTIRKSCGASGARRLEGCKTQKGVSRDYANLTLHILITLSFEWALMNGCTSFRLWLKKCCDISSTAFL